MRLKYARVFGFLGDRVPIDLDFGRVDLVKMARRAPINFDIPPRGTVRSAAGHFPATRSRWRRPHSYTRATDGQITGVTFTPHGGSAQSIASGVTYAPFGPLTGFTYGNGLNLTRAYDQDYRLTGLTVAPTTGAAAVNLTFAWQADGRLASSTDIVGNRTPAATTATLMKASLGAGANQLIGTTTLGGATQRTLTYKTGGDLVQDAHVGGTTYGYVYNAAKRLTTINQNGAAAGNYAGACPRAGRRPEPGDFAGRRVWRKTYGALGAQTAYVYDEDGHLLAEHNATTGAATREYVWIDDMPIALADIAGSTTTVAYITTGQIDEPLAVTNAAKALIWNGYVDAFGTASTFTTPTTPLDMRLPGQSFQLETGSLSQNGWRDYDPSLGRYVEADPLGIGAGQNVYAYVDGDPVNFTDSLGLAQTPGNDTNTCGGDRACGRALEICLINIWGYPGVANDNESFKDVVRKLKNVRFSCRAAYDLCVIGSTTTRAGSIFGNINGVVFFPDGTAVVFRPGRTDQIIPSVRFPYGPQP